MAVLSIANTILATISSVSDKYVSFLRRLLRRNRGGVKPASCQDDTATNFPPWKPSLPTANHSLPRTVKVEEWKRYGLEAMLTISGRPLEIPPRVLPIVGPGAQFAGGVARDGGVSGSSTVAGSGSSSPTATSDATPDIADVGLVGAVPPINMTLQAMSRLLREERVTIETRGIGSSGSSDYFYPDLAVWSLISVRHVRPLLGECGAAASYSALALDCYADRICDLPSSGKVDATRYSFRKIFALLILMNRAESIFQFVDTGIHDGLLLLPTIDPSNGGNESSPMRSWSPGERKKFNFLQWQLSAPHFRTDPNDKPLHYVFPVQTRLPFVATPTIDDSGGYGKVYMVTMHRDQESLPQFTESQPDGSRQFAIKQVRGTPLIERGEKPRDWFESEANINARLTLAAGHRRSRHLTKLLATFEIRGNTPDEAQFFLVFPRADMNLRRFWREAPAPALRPRGPGPGPMADAELGLQSRWLALQFLGLVRWLHIFQDFVHYRRGSEPWTDKNCGLHLDIKAENILLFTNWLDPPPPPLSREAKGDEDSGKEQQPSERREGKGNGNDDDDSRDDTWGDQERLRRLGVLQVTDFGLARFRSQNTAAQASPDPAPREWPYPPPQLDLLWIVDQSVDVWAMGCLFLEFLVWFFFGHDGLLQFNSDRVRLGHDIMPAPIFRPLFYSCVDVYARDPPWWRPGLRTRHEEERVAELSLNPAVELWVERIHKHERATKFVHEVLDYIMQEMVVIEDKSPELMRMAATAAAIPPPSSHPPPPPPPPNHVPVGAVPVGNDGSLAVSTHSSAIDGSSSETLVAGSNEEVPLPRELPTGPPPLPERTTPPPGPGNSRAWRLMEGFEKFIVKDLDYYTVPVPYKLTSKRRPKMRTRFSLQQIREARQAKIAVRQGRLLAYSI